MELDLEHHLTDVITSALDAGRAGETEPPSARCHLCGHQVMVIHFQLTASSLRRFLPGRREDTELALCLDCVENIAALHLMNRHLWVKRWKETVARENSDR